MIANSKYIYNEVGEVEAAIVPIQTWRIVEQKIQAAIVPIQTWRIVEQKIQAAPTPFQAAKFRGIFRHLNINVEQEIKKMRDEWTRNF